MRSLRDRKKDQTRAALAAAAFDIVRDHGAAALTADAVAARAGVSRRTFFNYFGSIDDAVAHSAKGLLDELTEAMAARPGDESIWDTLPAILTGPEGAPLIERIARLCSTRDHSPQARHLAQDHVQAFVAWLTGWLVERLGPETDVLYAATLAASVSATAEAAITVWDSRIGGTVTDEALDDLRDMLTRSLNLLRTGFAPVLPHGH